MDGAAQQPLRKTYAVVPPGIDGVNGPLEEPREAAALNNGLFRGRSFRRITGYFAATCLVSTAIATIWLRGARNGQKTTSLRSRVGLHESEGCKSYEVNIDYRGLDELRRVEKVTDSKKCRDLCLQATDCAAWTWGKLRNVKGFSDVCFLKKWKNGQKAQKFKRYGATAGMRSSTPCSGSILEAPPAQKGHIQSRDGFCLEAVEPVGVGSRLEMKTCDMGRTGQDWTYVEKTGQIQNGHGLCLDAVNKAKPFAWLQMYNCDSGNWSQQWSFDEETGLIKNWRGFCVDAAERNIDGGMVYIQYCDAGSANQRWLVGATSAPPPQPLYAPGTVYCFALMLPDTYEQDLLKMQYETKVSIFACDEYSVYSKRVVKVAEGLTTGVVNSDLKCKKGGEFGTVLNLDIFIAVWTKVVSDAIFERHDWTAKADPDAVFFPQRLKIILQVHSESKAGVYLNNCKYGLHGPVEVFSRNAVVSWALGAPRCVQHFQKKCGGDCFWGEDLFIDQCLEKVLGVDRHNDFRLLMEDHCDPPENWDSCTDRERVAFHPFKAMDGYIKCLGNAGVPAAELPHPTPAPALIQPVAEPAQPAAGPAKSTDLLGTPKAEVAKPVAPAPTAASTPGAPTCHTAMRDERCYVAVKWAMDYGVRLHPDWYDGLTEQSTFYDFQKVLHGRPHVECPMPCVG